MIIVYCVACTSHATHLTYQGKRSDLICPACPAHLRDVVIPMPNIGAHMWLVMEHLYNTGIANIYTVISQAGGLSRSRDTRRALDSLVCRGLIQRKTEDFKTTCWLSPAGLAIINHSGLPL